MTHRLQVENKELYVHVNYVGNMSRYCTEIISKNISFAGPQEFYNEKMYAHSIGSYYWIYTCLNLHIFIQICWRKLNLFWGPSGYEGNTEEKNKGYVVSLWNIQGSVGKIGWRGNVTSSPFYSRLLDRYLKTTSFYHIWSTIALIFQRWFFPITYVTVNSLYKYV